MSDKFEESIKVILDALLEGAITEAMGNNPETVDKLRKLSQEEGFFEKLKCAQDRFCTIVIEVIGIPKQRNMYIAEHIVSGLYEHFFRELMERSEGSPACADKARFITRMTMKALKENRSVCLYENYTKYDQIKENKEKQAYWSPRTVTDTDAAIELFTKWYYLRVAGKEE